MVVVLCRRQWYFSYIVTGHSRPDSKFWPASWHPRFGQLGFYSVPSIPWHGFRYPQRHTYSWLAESIMGNKTYNLFDNVLFLCEKALYFTFSNIDVTFTPITSRFVDLLTENKWPFSTIHIPTLANILQKSSFFGNWNRCMLFQCINWITCAKH